MVSDDEGLVSQSKEMMGLVLVLVEVAGVEPATPNCLQLYDIIGYN